MRSFVLTLAMLASVSVPVLVQAADSDEDRKNHHVATTYKRCVGGEASKSYSKEETENYCACFAVTITDRMTLDEYEAHTDHTWRTSPIRHAASAYCGKKYLGLPDVTAIRKKKW